MPSKPRMLSANEVAEKSSRPLSASSVSDWMHLVSSFSDSGSPESEGRWGKERGTEGGKRDRQTERGEVRGLTCGGHQAR